MGAPPALQMCLPVPLQFCLVGTSSSCPGLAKILMKENPTGSVLCAATHRVPALREVTVTGESFSSFPFRCTRDALIEDGLGVSTAW